MKRKRGEVEKKRNVEKRNILDGRGARGWKNLEEPRGSGKPWPSHSHCFALGEISAGFMGRNSTYKFYPLIRLATYNTGNRRVISRALAPQNSAILFGYSGFFLKVLRTAGRKFGRTARELSLNHKSRNDSTVANITPTAV